jgi:DNA-binding Lrp family transcriptional regulator
MMPGLKLDRIDLKILAKLQQAGRVTNVELADAVGLSPSPCLTRVKRLEQAGYITGYGAHLNLGKLGEFLTVFTEVTLSEHRRGDFRALKAGSSSWTRSSNAIWCRAGMTICSNSSRAAFRITSRSSKACWKAITASRNISPMS